MSRIKNLALYKKIILLVIGFIFLLGISNIFIIKEYVYNMMLREVTKRGLSIGRNLSENCVEYILTDNIVELQKIISRTRKTEKDIIYIFIQDRKGTPVVHTFKNFPEGLDKMNYLISDKTYRMQLLRTEKELVRDIALPILGGSIGTVRIGISEKYIQERVSSIIIRIIVIMSVILVIGTMLTYIFTMKTLSPLREIASAIKRIGEGSINQKINIKSGDEIGLLAHTFNEMAEKLEKTKNQLIQTAKLATVGQFAAGIAHEINNPLGAIINYIRTLLANPEIKGENRGYLELTLKGLFRIENIVRQILSYSSYSESSSTNINQLLKESIAFVQHKLLAKNINLNLKLDNSLPNILLDAGQINQVFINIINNAIDALSFGGKLTIETSLIHEPKGSTPVQIKFIDNGIGVKEENLDKIFDPFWTTKEVGEGTGLGLFICYNIIRLHKGTIDVKSKEGVETTVIVTLPKGVKNYGK